jgi:hypothetical protein
MPQKEFNQPYPVIDTDPHFSRVVRYMRPSDYAAWAAGTAAAPGLLLAMGKIIPRELLNYARMKELKYEQFNRKNGSRRTYS